MVRKVLFTALVAFLSVIVKAQTKGTNTLGLGFGASQKQSTGDNKAESNGIYFNVIYGNFIKENVKLAAGTHYGNSKSAYFFSGDERSSESNYLGGFLTYQKYYRLLNKFYAYASAGPSYSYSKNEQSTISYYNVDLSGGASYFASDRFALEVSLLSAGGGYTVQRITQIDSKETTKSFNISTAGSLTNLNFRIYFLF